MMRDTTAAGPATRGRVRVRGGAASALAVALLLAALALLAPPAAAQGSAQVDVEGGRVTVDVQGIPGHQVRVELQDDSIASTALILPDGRTQMVFELPPGEYQLEVITFDPAGIPTTVGTYPVTVAGPPPPAPGVEVTPGSPGDNRSIVRLTGPADTDFEVQIVRDGQTRSRKEGTLSAEGTGAAVFVLPSGPWGYVATLRNTGGVSPGTLGEFTADIGTPSPPGLELTSPEGANPAVLAVTGPAAGVVEVTARHEDGETVEEEVDLDEQGAGQVELDLPEDGAWEVEAVAVDVADQRSEPATLEGGLEVKGDGPPLTLERLGSGGGVFHFRITTDEGVQVSVNGGIPALTFEFTSKGVDEFEIEMPEGDHVIEVRAVDALGNRTVDTLSSRDSGGGGIPWGVLGLIVLGLLAALGVFAFLRRQELIDWWNTRQYH